MREIIRRLPWHIDGSGEFEPLLTREWLITNGLGGYASGTLASVLTRRFHGLLIAALPSPIGRRMMLNDMDESLCPPGQLPLLFGGEDHGSPELKLHASSYLKEFRIEDGLPTWRYEVEGYVVEKQLLMPHRQNTVHVTYRLFGGAGPVRLELRPFVHFRPHEAPLSMGNDGSYALTVVESRYEFSVASQDPPLRLYLHGQNGAFTYAPRVKQQILYRIEESRGYDHRGDLWSGGYFHADLDQGHDITLVASTEDWETILALTPQEAVIAERGRRQRLVVAAHIPVEDGFAAELVLAADQFLITPAGRVEDVARARASGDEVRTVVAGYHWFTDWGRDTMISLEGLTLSTGRYQEAAWILRTFSHYIRGGLIPNMFPEGEKEGLYHTADATLWFFHAIDRYVEITRDRELLRSVLPSLLDIVDHHVRGTGFGIGVDKADGLLRQGAEGYQLTWMDAKVDGWVVTPRRGKAVEINALWYNALCLLAQWVTEEYAGEMARPLQDHADRARESFNKRFWYADGGYLYDVVDGEDGRDDPACRPNQVMAISPRYPVLDRSKWEPVMQVVRERLLTPFGLRSLSPDHPDYKARYYGDLRARDAAYHQGTVWAWLIGPFVDAWLKTYPNDIERARALITGFESHLTEACVGSISEVFDADAPYTPRGCAAQAWSIAEVLRCLRKTAEPALEPAGVPYGEAQALR